MALSYAGTAVIDILEPLNDVQTLSERWDKLPCARLWMNQLTSAVTHLHSLEMAHRDVKWDNVIVTPAQIVKLIDFGHAQFLRDEYTFEISIEQTTPVYTAPDVYYYIIDDERAPDPRKAADVFALGVCGYSLVTGRMPADHKTLLQAFDAYRTSGGPPGLRLLGESNLPCAGRFLHLCAQCMDFEPSRRPRSADIVWPPFRARSQHTIDNESASLADDGTNDSSRKRKRDAETASPKSVEQRTF